MITNVPLYFLLLKGNAVYCPVQVGQFCAGLQPKGKYVAYESVCINYPEIDKDGMDLRATLLLSNFY